MAQTRLSDLDALGCACEVKLLGDSDEVAQLAKVHCPQKYRKKERRGFPRRPDASGQRPYAHFGSPSLLAGASPVVPFFFNDAATTEIYTLSLHDALPISLIVGPTTPLVVA